MVLQEVVIEKINTRDGIITVKTKKGKEYTAKLPENLKAKATTIYVEYVAPVYVNIVFIVHEAISEKTPICKGFYVEV